MATDPAAAEPTNTEQATCPNLTLKEFLLWLLRKRSRLRVTGNSMQPLLQPNEEILINPHAYSQQAPQPGDIVVSLHPSKPDLPIIKCVEAVTEGKCFLLGKNPAESTDSRSFGWVDNGLLQGQVTCRFGS